MTTATVRLANPEVIGYDLSLTTEEAEALSAVLGSIGGKGPLRDLVGGISRALDDLDVYYDEDLVAVAHMTDAGRWEHLDNDIDYGLVFAGEHEW